MEYETVDIGNEIQLLADDHIIHDEWLIQRSPELPSKYLENPIFTESPVKNSGIMVYTVIYDEDDKIFKMWYGFFDTDAYYKGKPGSYNIAYATSSDGISWDTPKLGLFEFEGSGNNSAVFYDAAGCVLKDTADKDSSRRYKLIYNRNGLRAAYSPDGINWRLAYPETEKPLVEGPNDTMNNVVYDEKLNPTFDLVTM